MPSVGYSEQQDFKCSDPELENNEYILITIFNLSMSSIQSPLYHHPHRYNVQTSLPKSPYFPRYLFQQ